MQKPQPRRAVEGPDDKIAEQERECAQLQQVKMFLGNGRPYEYFATAFQNAAAEYEVAKAKLSELKNGASKCAQV
jgi:hypothetical protein